MLEFISSDGLLKIVSFRNSPKFDSFLTEIETFRKGILASRHLNDLNTIDNYSFENFVISHQAGFSIAYFNGEIIAISSMFVNADYYPKKSVRLLNRFYSSPSTRSQIDSESSVYKSKNRTPIIGPIMAAQQASLAKKFGFKWGFVSREMNNSRWSKMFCLALCEKTSMRWFVLPKLAALCGRRSPRCWQHVIFTNLKQSDSIEKISFKNEMAISSYLTVFGPNSKNRN